MTSLERAFWPVFASVCKDYALSKQAREIAWLACHKQDKNGKAYLDPYARGIYHMLAATRPPYVIVRPR